MTVDVIDEGQCIRVVYTDGDGNTASAAVAGESKSAVSDRADEIVDTHSLKDQAGNTQ